MLIHLCKVCEKGQYDWASFSFVEKSLLLRVFLINNKYGRLTISDPQQFEVLVRFVCLDARTNVTWLIFYERIITLVRWYNQGIIPQKLKLLASHKNEIGTTHGDLDLLSLPTTTGRS